MRSRSDVSPWFDMQLFVGWLVLGAVAHMPPNPMPLGSCFTYEHRRTLGAELEVRARDLARTRCTHPQCRTCQPWGAS